MEIKTKYEIKDKVYFFKDKLLRKGKLIEIKILDSEILYIVEETPIWVIANQKHTKHTLKENSIFKDKEEGLKKAKIWYDEEMKVLNNIYERDKKIIIGYYNVFVNEIKAMKER